MLSRDQAKTMLSLQSAMNARVDSNWLAARYPYLRAVAIEGAEAIEHHGWKWWKKQVKDLPQLQMEIIDIWHFILSEMLLRREGSLDKSLDWLLAELEECGPEACIHFDACDYRPRDLDLLAKLELLIALAAVRRIEIALFASIMADCDLDWTELYRQYVGKNVLNLFRQDYGYQAGTYEKLWEGREDNEHLVEIIDRLDPEAADFKEAIYAGLAAAYPAADERTA